MYRIGKTFTFDAAHKLVPPYEGRCSRFHGHTYKVEVILKADMLDPCGMVRDFSHLAPVKQFVAQKLDHSCLNDTLEQPTAENIAKYIFDFVDATDPHVESVRVWETPQCWGEYSR